jgi:hypothetical protein
MNPQPYKPSAAEREQYYLGLPGHAELIARTGTEQWHSPRYHVGTFGGIHKKYLAGIDHPDLIAKWSERLSRRLIEILKDCPWEWFVPLRVGLDNDANHYEKHKPKRSTMSTVLMIGVPKDKINWEKAVVFALDCRKALREHGINDLEVEIRDGSYQEQAACAELEAQINMVEPSFRKTNNKTLPMLSYSGFPVAYLEDRKGQGTIGGYITLDDDPSTYGLTCRHVVARKRQPFESYTSGNGPKQFHVQVNQTLYHDVLYELKYYKSDLEQEAHQLEQKETRWESWYQFQDGKEHLRPTEEEREVLKGLRLKLTYHNKILDLVKGLGKRSSKNIGELAYHSSSQISFQQKGYLKDWALIKMDSTKFSQTPTTKVFVGDAIHEFMAKNRLSKSSDFYENYSNGVLSLRVEGQKKQGSYHVCKQGARTGLTFGQVSGIEAVARRRDRVGDSYSWELVVIPEPGAGPFSDRGDSGSCVFDLDGHIVGLLVASNSVIDKESTWEMGMSPDGDGSSQIKIHPDQDMGPGEAPEANASTIQPWPKEADITFVSPIKWVLDDIQELTGRKPRFI